MFFNKIDCSVAIPMFYDLKAHGYDTSEIECKFPNNQFPYDVVLKRGDDLSTAIVIIIDADTCYIEPENLKNRAIEVKVRCENDIFELYNGALREGIARFYNFENKDVKTIPLEKVNRKILRFTLFSSGRYYMGEEKCVSTPKRSAIYEVVISSGSGSYKSMKQFAVLHCYNQQKTLCLCEICYYLRSVDNFFNHESICIRYKTKHTPRNPLKIMPVKCPFFSLNKNLESTLKKEYQDVRIIETII